MVVIIIKLFGDHRMKLILKNFDFCVKIFIITGTQYALFTYTYIRSTIHVNCLKKLMLLILIYYANNNITYVR